MVHQSEGPQSPQDLHCVTRINLDTTGGFATVAKLTCKRSIKHVNTIYGEYRKSREAEATNNQIICCLH